MKLNALLTITSIFLFISHSSAQITIWKIDTENKHGMHHIHVEDNDNDEESILYPCGTSYYSELHDEETSHTSFWSVKNEGSSTISITDPLWLSGGIDRFTLKANYEAFELIPGEEFHFEVTYNGLSGSQAQVNIQSTFGLCSLIIDGGTSDSLCDISWSGPTTGLWDVGANWDLNRVPIDDDLVCIFSANVTISSAAVADAVWVQGSLTIASNHSLTLDRTLLGTGGSSLDNGLNIVNSSVDNYGRLFINNAPANGIYLENSTFVNRPGASIEINSPDEGISFDDGISTFTNDGSINISDAARDGMDLDGTSFSFINYGMITINNSGQEGIDVEPSQSSTAINNGTITIDDAESDALQIDKEGSFINASNLSIRGSVKDDVEVNDNGIFRNSGNVLLNSPGGASAIEVQDSGRIINELCGIINVLSEDLQLQDSLTSFLNDGILAIVGDHVINNGTFTNNGRIVTTSGIITFSNAIIDNGSVVTGAIPTNDSLCNEPIPTMSQWSVIILFINVLIIGLVGLKQRRLGLLQK